jgi:hypothetical protein
MTSTAAPALTELHGSLARHDQQREHCANLAAGTGDAQKLHVSTACCGANAFHTTIIALVDRHYCQ